jgi:hypothetical protein
MATTEPSGPLDRDYIDAANDLGSDVVALHLDVDVGLRFQALEPNDGMPEAQLAVDPNNTPTAICSKSAAKFLQRLQSRLAMAPGHSPGLKSWARVTAMGGGKRSFAIAGSARSILNGLRRPAL